MVTEEMIKSCQNQLLKRQYELIQHMRDQLQSFEQSIEVSKELSNYDNHPADAGSALFERSKDMALYEREERELDAINRALHAIEEGTYGICTVCGREIAYERLKAQPTA